MKKIFLLTALLATTLMGCHRRSFDEQMLDEIQTYNEKYLPRQADEYTIETKRYYVPKTRELVDEFDVIDNGNLDLLLNEDTHNQLRDALLNSLRYDIEAKTMKDSSVIFTYRYRNQTTRKILFDETFTPEDYN